MDKNEREPGPASAEALYRRWEAEPWGAHAIDFSADTAHWNDRLDDKQRRSALWILAMFRAGVSSEARMLAAMLDSVPKEPERAFLATQIADETRHKVLLARFLNEVVGRSAGRSVGAAGDERLTWGFRQLLGEMDRVSDALRKRRGDNAVLAGATALCHIIIEGVLAIPGEHFLASFVEQNEILPGLASGLRSCAADEQRHVSFGTGYLSELVADSRDCRTAAVQMWDRTLPWMVGVFIPPDLDASYVECFDFTLNDIYALGLRTFESKVRRVGIDPADLYLLARDERSLPYDERARRLLVLVESGVIGDDTRQPRLSPEAFQILFDSMQRAVSVDVARSLEGPIEWAFTDTESWHLVVSDGAVEARRGKPERPALRLEIASADWAKIAVGRIDARWSLLRRKLRVHGPLAAKAKLSKLFV